MKNKVNMDEINTLLSELNSKIREIDRKKQPEPAVFGTKIFKHPELIFKKKENIETKLPKIENALKNRKKSLENNRPNIKKIMLKEEKVRSLEEVEDRIKAIHLKSEDALMRFVEIRQDLIKSKENRPCFGNEKKK